MKASPPPLVHRAVFFDKDGTLVHDVPYNVDPARIELREDALECLALLQQHGFKLLILTNQAGVAHGRFPEQALRGVEQRLRELCTARGITLDGFYYCPHHPAGRVPGYTQECDCRKPAPGLLIQAATEHGIDLSASWMVGDILNDVEAGRRAGCRTVLLDVGNETEWVRGPLRTPHAVATTLGGVAEVIVNHQGARGSARHLPVHHLAT